MLVSTSDTRLMFEQDEALVARLFAKSQISPGGISISVFRSLTFRNRTDSVKRSVSVP